MVLIWSKHITVVRVFESYVHLLAVCRSYLVVRLNQSIIGWWSEICVLDSMIYADGIALFLSALFENIYISNDVYCRYTVKHNENNVNVKRFIRTYFNIIQIKMAHFLNTFMGINIRIGQVIKSHNVI